MPAKSKKKPAKKTAAKAKPAKKTATKAKPAAKAKKSAGRGGAANSAFMKPMQPDDALSAVVGASPIPRSEVTKRVWAYIKKNGLQDAKDRRSINADATLGPVLDGKKKVTMFELTKHVNNHLS
jgi:upstream activation factor subunit UAF30